MPQNTLTEVENERIYREAILKELIPPHLSSPAHPRAIILAGQPGAGKGGLATRAETELRGDLVTIDLDELRKFHPQIDEFRERQPYTWSGETHEDAKRWTDRLLNDAVDGRKHFVFDTTLSNGEWASGGVGRRRPLDSGMATYYRRQYT